MCCVVRYQLDGTIRPCHQSSTPRDWYWCSLEEERTAGHYPLLTIVLTRWGYQKMKITSPPCHWALYFLYHSSWPNHLACKKCKTPLVWQWLKTNWMQQLKLPDQLWSERRFTWPAKLSWLISENLRDWEFTTQSFPVRCAFCIIIYNLHYQPVH